MKSRLENKKEIEAQETKQGKVYQYKDRMLMRCSGSSKPRFVDIHTAEFMILGYKYKVAPLKQVQPAIFEFKK